MVYQTVTWPMTSRDPQRCCEAVRSAILATAWLLVKIGYLTIPGKYPWTDSRSHTSNKRKPCYVAGKLRVARCRCNFPRWRMAAILDLIETEIAPLDPPTPKTLHYETWMWIGWPVAKIWPFEIRHISQGGVWHLHFRWRGGRRGHWSYQWKERCWFLPRDAL